MVSLIVFSIVSISLAAIGLYLRDIKENMPMRLSLFCSSVVFLIIGIVSYPAANVWQKQLSGKAKLREAEWSTQVKIKESEAFLESSKNFALGEVERAKGAAEANKIVANGLGGPEGYLRYLFIEGLKIAHENGNQIIYIPTETGMPITESARILKVNQQ